MLNRVKNVINFMTYARLTAEGYAKNSKDDHTPGPDGKTPCTDKRCPYILSDAQYQRDLKECQGILDCMTLKTQLHDIVSSSTGVLQLHSSDGKSVAQLTQLDQEMEQPCPFLHPITLAQRALLSLSMPVGNLASALKDFNEVQGPASRMQCKGFVLIESTQSLESLMDIKADPRVTVYYFLEHQVPLARTHTVTPSPSNNNVARTHTHTQTHFLTYSLATRSSRNTCSLSLPSTS